MCSVRRKTRTSYDEETEQNHIRSAANQASFEAQRCTSQSGRQKEVGAIFLDETLCNHLEGWPPPQLADGVHEVRVEGQSQTAAAETVSLLQRQAVDLPSTKLPGSTTEITYMFTFS